MAVAVTTITKDYYNQKARKTHIEIQKSNIIMVGFKPGQLRP